VQAHVGNIREALLFQPSTVDCRALAIACREMFYGTPQENFDHGASAQRAIVLREIERLRSLDTVGTEAKQVLGKLEQGLREGSFTPSYGGRENSENRH